MFIQANGYHIKHQSSSILEVPSERDKYKINPFIEANTKEVSLSHLEEKCTIPVFAKDNEVTLSHQDYWTKCEYIKEDFMH